MARYSPATSLCPRVSLTVKSWSVAATSSLLELSKTLSERSAATAVRYISELLDPLFLYVLSRRSIWKDSVVLLDKGLVNSSTLN